MIDQTLTAIGFTLLMLCVFLIIDAKCSNRRNNRDDEKL